MDLTESIAPKSDQLNAEDLLTGPRTFTIAKVEQGTAEQPVHVHLTEFPGRPFKPSKTVRRLMVAAWGKDSAAYTGCRMTLYRDPAVRFGGQDVGGIRVSHMSGIDKRIVVALTITRGKRAPYTVEPLPEVAPNPMQGGDDFPAEQNRLNAMFAEFGRAGFTSDPRSDEGRKARLDYCAKVLGRPIESSKDMQAGDVERVINALKAQEARP